MCQKDEVERGRGGGIRGIHLRCCQEHESAAHDMQSTKDPFGREESVRDHADEERRQDAREWADRVGPAEIASAKPNLDQIERCADVPCSPDEELEEHHRAEARTGCAEHRLIVQACTKMGSVARIRERSGKLEAEALYAYALRALGRRSLTQAELESRLLIRCADQRDVSAILQRLRDAGYLSDEQVAESHSAFRREYALIGRKRVLGELRRRGVNEETAAKAVADAYDDSDEIELAREYLRRKLGARFGQVCIADRKELARLYRALLRAGFGPVAVADALRCVAADTEWLEALAEASVSDHGDA